MAKSALDSPSARRPGSARARLGSKGVPIASLILVDLIAVCISTFFAVIGRTNIAVFSQASDVDTLVAPIVALLALGWVALVALWGSYNPIHLGTGTSEYQRVLFASFSFAGVIGIAAYLTQYPLSRGFFVLLFLLGIPMILMGRYGVRRLIHAARQAGHLQTRVVISGDESHIDDLATVLHRERWLGYEVVGALIEDPAPTQTRAGIPVVGHTSALVTALDASKAEVVIFAEGSFGRGVEFNRLARELEDHHARMIVVPSLTDVSAERVRVRPVAGIPLVHVDSPRARGAHRWTKRLFDLVGSSLLIVAVSPVMLATAIAIRREDGGPILFRQQRAGLEGRPFAMLKFRSMVTDAEKKKAELLDQNESDGVLFKVANDPRITRTGRFIRRFSIDELPQFINVWRGDMSLVGPRPALLSEVDEYRAHVRRRLDVRPGITGLWQVSGRSDLSWDETVRLDLYYVDNWSMLQDLSILARTIGAVLASRGAY